jgi:hypothetical protein
MAAAVLAVDELAEPVEEAALADGDAGAAELVLRAERRELLHRVGQQRNPDAEFPDLRGALERAADEPAIVQIQGERQATVIPPPTMALSMAGRSFRLGPGHRSAVAAASKR